MTKFEFVQTSKPAKFITEVEALLNDGWTPMGNMTMAGDSGCWSYVLGFTKEEGEA